MENGAYLLKLEIENVRCFGEKAMLDLSDGNGNWKKWTVILGNNGTGKTTLLKVISPLELKEDEYNGQKSYSANTLLLFLNGKDLLRNKKERLRITALTTHSTKADYSISLSFDNVGSQGFASVISDRGSFKIYGYGANRFMSCNSLTDIKSENSATLFDDDAKLTNAEEWLLQLDYAASKDSSIKEFAKNRRYLVEDILLKILPDIEAIQFTDPTKENLKSSVKFFTPFGWVTIHQLSLGYKTMVAWMVDLAARMFERYPNSDNPLTEPAIVLVDEIDLHMHPKWQRKIFDYLSEKFPETQFIVTAHSPLIVQSAPKDANIVLLRREGDHVVIDNDIQSVHNWRIDQILNSDLFGNISQRSAETEEWMNEREELILKDKLTEDEKKRLDILNEKAYSIPTADDPMDIKAMDLIRKATHHFKTQSA